MRGICRSQRRIALLAAAVVSVTPLGAGAADQWQISIGVRETGSTGAIGTNGGQTGPIEWIDLDGFTLNADDTWHTATWNFAPGMHTATNFSGGNGILSAANNKGVLEHIRIRNSGGNSGGEIRLRIDDIVNTVGGAPTTITGFEGFSTATANDTLMFREPIFSGSTLANMSTGPNGTLISTASANSGTQSLAARWTFVPNGNTSQWLRLTTANATTLGNPIIDIGPSSTLSIAFRMSVYNPTGTRVRGLDASQFQGSGHDWVRAAAPMSAGGGGMTFAFLRATRGGTSGTSSTGSMRVDDPQYAANIAGAKAAGLLTGPYHFGRPDMWTTNAAGTIDSPTTVGTPEDEARHYLEIAGKHMKPGYMRPVYDLEDGDVETSKTQMGKFVNRFNDTIVKYKGPAAALIVYCGSNYAQNEVDGTVAGFPLWMPRYNVESDWSQGNPAPFSTDTYGPWDTPEDPHPWKFWQYYSPDVYIPGINAGTHNDIDVAHGDINFVRQYLVQGAIWDGSGGSAWATGANWDTNVQPTSTTEVLFDVGTPGTITLTAGRSASGIYFAENNTLSGGSLTLSDGRIDVDSGKTGTIATNLSTPNGFRKVGLGTMTHASGASTVTGVAQVLQGTMNVSGGSINVGELMVNPELTQFDKSLIAPFPADANQITSATLNVNGGSMTAFSAYVGGTDTASGAIGTLNVSSGTLAITGPLKIWNSAVPMVDSKVNLSGGTLSVGSLDTNGDIASFNWTGGIFAVTGAGGLSVASGGPVGSSLAVGTGKQLIVFNALTVGAGSNVALQNNAAVTVGSLDVGGDQSRFSWSSGTLTINGPGTSDLGTRTIGVGAGPMFLNIGGGSVSNGTLTVGALSNGTVSQTGGTHTISTLNIGVGVVSTGMHSVSGGVLDVTGDAYVGGNIGGASGGTGILNVSGGNVEVGGTLKVWDSGAAAPGGTRVNLTGGILSVGSIDAPNIARINLDGGAIIHNGPGSSNLGGLTVGPTVPSSLILDGGTITADFGSPITVGPVGVLEVNSGTTLDAEVENSGTMHVNGGTVTMPVDNQNILNISGNATFNTVDTPGTTTVNSGANVAFTNGIAGPGTITLESGANANSPVVAALTLNIHGNWHLAPDWPAAAAIAGDLDVTGRLDLKNNRMIALTTPLGTWDGSSYDGVTGMIQSGRGNGSWNGNGIVTSMSDATGGVLTTLAVALAEDVGYAGGTFAGWEVSAGNVLVMYTWGGDAELDGDLDGDDYFQIDSNVGQSGTVFGFHKGDFDYDGDIDGDDYFIIDGNIAFAQTQPPFPTSSGGPISAGLQTVPEPASLIWLLAAGTSLGCRRRRG